jgi:hypothetical protein
MGEDIPSYRDLDRTRIGSSPASSWDAVYQQSKFPWTFDYVTY